MNNPGIPMMKLSNRCGLGLTGSPPAATQRIDHELILVVRTAGMRDKVSDAGIELLSGSPPVLAGITKTHNPRDGSLATDLAIQGD
jgi:hypothetical protein